MRGFLTGVTRREKQFAVAGIVIALVFFMPFLALADPGAISGSGPSDTRPDVAAETPVDVERGDSCRNMLAADTPNYVVCRWLTPPQDAAAVAAFWGADGGANMEAARPLPQQYVRCNQKTDLSRSVNCRGGQTFCKELPSGWYRCENGVTGKVTYERYVNGRKEVRTTPPADVTTPTAAPQATTPAVRPKATATATAPVDADPVDPAPTVSASPSASADPDVTPLPEVPGSAPVATAVAAAQEKGLRTWVETDLADDFRAGDAQFRAALAALVANAGKPGVTGVKFADYLGFRDFTSAAEVKRFVAAATGALRAKLPGKRLAIGVVVPELGCGSAKDCVADMRSRYPLVTKAKVDDYLRSSAVDRVYVASGLFGKSYGGYQVTLDGKATAITPAIAAQAQWMSVKALGWDAVVQVGSREYGLTHQGDTSPWDKARAQAEVDARIGSAIGLGAQTVTLWGHRVSYDTEHRRILDAGLAGNEVWRALTGKGLRNRLSVLFDPASPEVGVAEDIAALAKGVSEIFVLS